MRRFVPFLLMVFVLSACNADKTADATTKLSALTSIALAMNEQENAWNEGDLEGFMEHYWKSDSLRFIGSRGLNYGWQTTLENYKESYPDREAMGTLTFSNKYMDMVAPDAAFIVGKWQLDRRSDTLSGHYSLLWKQIEGKWVIVADHSS